MGFYASVVFPRLCDLLLDSPVVEPHRRELLASVRGQVLEIGFGTGLNLPHYPASVRGITAVDPNPGMHRRARMRIAQSGVNVDKHVVSSEHLAFDADRFDCVVSTFTLCSIEHVGRALDEIYRVLKPDGRFLFLEHGLSPDPRVQTWQRRLNWLERRLADNCRLDRNVRELVAGQPFRSLEVAEFYLARTPRTHGYIYRGQARK